MNNKNNEMKETARNNNRGAENKKQDATKSQNKNMTTGQKDKSKHSEKA